MARRILFFLTLVLAVGCAGGPRTGRAPQEGPRPQPVAVLVASTEDTAELPAVALETLTDVPVDIRPRYTVVDKMRAWGELREGGSP